MQIIKSEIKLDRLSFVVRSIVLCSLFLNVFCSVSDAKSTETKSNSFNQKMYTYSNRTWLEAAQLDELKSMLNKKTIIQLFGQSNWNETNFIIDSLKVKINSIDLQSEIESKKDLSNQNQTNDSYSSHQPDLNQDHHEHHTANKCHKLANEIEQEPSATAIKMRLSPIVLKVNVVERLNKIKRHLKESNRHKELVSYSILARIETVYKISLNDETVKTQLRPNSFLFLRDFKLTSTHESSCGTADIRLNQSLILFLNYNESVQHQRASTDLDEQILLNNYLLSKKSDEPQHRSLFKRIRSFVIGKHPKMVRSLKHSHHNSNYKNHETLKLALEKMWPETFAPLFKPAVIDSDEHLVQLEQEIQSASCSDCGKSNFSIAFT
jgi:hypothetical protein